ncbi:MAG: YqeG family HAD IIIA-type phosphatase [Clostridiales bacterium]|nr:YqeG family HAD IIIA-type phosphatase [Clostridiales bacterium]
MLKKLYPDIYVKSIEYLPLKELKKRGIKALVFDIDNTIAPYDVAEPDDWAFGVLDHIREEGFKICLLSNNNENRIKIFNRKIGAYAYWKAGKPGIKMLQTAMADMGTDSLSTAMVGDQVFTDVWCGHNAGMLSIMTAPICNRDQLITKVKRPPEKIIMAMYFRYRRKHPDAYGIRVSGGK